MMAGARPAVLEWAAANLTDISIALAAAVAIVMLLYGVRALVLRMARRLGPHHPFAAVFASTVRRTHLWFLVALAVAVVENYLHPPPEVTATVSFLFTVAAALQGAIWARTLILGLVERRAVAHGADAASLASAIGIIRVLVSVAVFAIAAIVVLDNLGANVTGLVAGLGIGGIAIGLAAQGIFSDLFAALSIIFDKPFQVGDVITYQGKEGPITGRVQQIGLKSTRIRSLTGELRIIGNTQLLAQEVTNYAGRELYQFRLPVGVTYQTDPALAAQIPALMEAEVVRAGHRFVRAAFVGFGPSSMDFEMLFEVDTDTFGAARLAHQDVALGVLKAFNERGIQFAYPTRTHFTAAPDGRMILPYAPAIAEGQAGDSAG